MFCKKCGTENADYARFCKKCGAPVEPVQFYASDLCDPQPNDTYPTEDMEDISEYNNAAVAPDSNTEPVYDGYTRPMQSITKEAYAQEVYAQDSYTQDSYAQGGAASSKTAPSKQLATILMIVAFAVHLAAAALFSLLPVYKVSVDVTAQDASYSQQVQKLLGDDKVELPHTENLTVFDIIDKELPGFEFLDVDTNEALNYVAIGLIAFSAIGGLVMLIPVFYKRTLHPAIGLSAVFAQVVMLAGAAVLLIVAGNSIKEAVDTYLVNFAGSLVLEQNVAIESTTTVGISVLGFVFIGVVVISVILNALAVIVGRKSVQSTRQYEPQQNF